MPQVEKRKSKTSGNWVFTFTIGTTFYQRFHWHEVIEIINQRRDDIQYPDAGYGQGRYMGD